MAANEPGQPPQPHAQWTNDLTVPAVALAIGAHPDDVEFGCGATLAKWAAQGCLVHHLILTDGSKGTWNPNADTTALSIQRQREQRAAAQQISPHRADKSRGEVVFLEQTDGELESSLAMRGRVARCIRQFRPDVILGHDPWKRYRIHPDHRHAGLLACEGIVAARDPHFFKEHLMAPARPHTLLLWEADEPDHYEEVGTFIDVKLDALEAHTSQFESTMHATSSDQLADFRSRIRHRLVEQGRSFGVDAAEVFKRIEDL